MIQNILNKIDSDEELSKYDAIELLEVDNKSSEFYDIISKSNQLTRSNSNNKGYVFVQVGINADCCSGNCKFCSLAKDVFTADDYYEKSIDDIIEQIEAIDFDLVGAFFLMATADYDNEKFLEMGLAVKKRLPSHVILVANVGDFDLEYANRLKEVGFTAAYHIVRLREGVDTDIPKENRIKTLEAIRDSGLELYYCVEPIGEEHTYDEISDEMIRARDYDVNVMAVMFRIPVKGTQYELSPEVSELESIKIAAVTNLVTKPKKSMNIHEPKRMALLAGINQLYAEIGVNPRDSNLNTELNRGYTTDLIVKMFEDAEYTL